MITRILVPAALLVGLSLSAGCSSDAGNGALIGGGVGALAGGIIGHQSGHTAGGALIGGAIGAGTGALIGHASDENKKDQREAYNRGYDDANRDGRSYNDRAPNSRGTERAGYTSYSESSRTRVGSGGYSSERTTTASNGSYYER